MVGVINNNNVIYSFSPAGLRFENIHILRSERVIFLVSDFSYLSSHTTSSQKGSRLNILCGRSHRKIFLGQHICTYVQDHNRMQTLTTRCFFCVFFLIALIFNAILVKDNKIVWVMFYMLLFISYFFTKWYILIF